MSWKTSSGTPKKNLSKIDFVDFDISVPKVSSSEKSPDPGIFLLLDEDFLYHGILLGRSKNGVFRFFFIRDLWAVWCPQTGKTKKKLKLEVFGEILGNFSTPPGQPTENPY